jgi:hypothetical protein
VQVSDAMPGEKWAGRYTLGPDAFPVPDSW